MRWMVGVVALAAAGCSEKPDERAKLSDGVVYAATYTCKKDDCVLSIKTLPPIDLAVPPCGDVDLAEEASGKAIGYRCKGGAWNVVRLRSGNRYLEDCNTVLGSATRPDWSKVGAVEPKAMQLLDCGKGSARAWAEIAREIAEDSGPELAAKYVVATTLRPSTNMGDVTKGYEDGWVLAFDGLPPAAQALVRKETCPALQNAASPSLLYARAARRCPLDATNVGDIALTAFKNHLTASRIEFGGLSERHGAQIPPNDLNAAELAFVMEGFIALKQRPKEVAEAACDRIANYSRDYDPIRASVAGSILALTKTRCPAVDRKSDLWPCDLVAPQKSAISAEVAKFESPPPGAPPIVPSPSYALFEAVSIDGKYPPNWSCP